MTHSPPDRTPDPRFIANNIIWILARAHAACVLIDEAGSGHPRGYTRRVKRAAKRRSAQLPPRRANALAHLLIREGREEALRSATAVATYSPARVVESTTYVALMSVWSDVLDLTRLFDAVLDVDLRPTIVSFDVAFELTWREALNAAIDAFRPYATEVYQAAVTAHDAATAEGLQGKR